MTTWGFIWDYEMRHGDRNPFTAIQLILEHVVRVTAHALNPRRRVLTKAARLLRSQAALRFNEFGPYDARGAALWDAGCWIDPDDCDRVRHPQAEATP